MSLADNPAASQLVKLLTTAYYSLHNGQPSQLNKYIDDNPHLPWFNCQQPLDITEKRARLKLKLRYRPETRRCLQQQIWEIVTSGDRRPFQIARPLDHGKVILHQHSRNKLHDWALVSCFHQVMVITDSEWACADKHPGLQIQVFPGAKFYHLTSVLKSYSGPFEPKVNILLSILGQSGQISCYIYLVGGLISLNCIHIMN